MISDGRTKLLSLPNELLRYGIFIYLQPIDLLHGFGQLHNRRLNALLSMHIRHVDLSRSVISIETELSFVKDEILSLRLNGNYLDDHVFSILPRLNRLDLQLTSAFEKVSQLMASTRLKVLSITSTFSDQPARLEGLASHIFHPDSCLEHLFVENCFVLDRDDLYPTSSCSLMLSRNLTCLSLDLAHICFAIKLMPFVPALEHFQVRLYNVYDQPSIFTPGFLERQAWSTKLKSLRLIAHEQLMDTASFCAFVKRFGFSLEHLSFYMSTRQCFLMSRRHSFERHLLVHLSKLKRLDFCVHSGVIDGEIDRRRTFDSWTKKQVISIFHVRQFHTRFTLPFAFDRLERVCSAFAQFHLNTRQPDMILSLPSLVRIDFDPSAKLNLALFTLVQQACSSLRRLQFKKSCHLSDDLLDDTQITLPTVTELCLGDVSCSMDLAALRRVLSLTPNLRELTAKQQHITIMMDAINSDANLFTNIIRLTIFNCCFQSDKIQENIPIVFPTASITYRVGNHWKCLGV